MTMMKRPAAVKLAPDDRSAWAMLQRARPLVEWHKASLRSAALTGAGQLSRVMVGADDDGGVWVGIVRPGREGPLNPAVFAVPASIGLSFERVERREDWLVGGEFPLAGCRPARGLRLLRVVDGASEAVTLFYWNADDRRFAAYAHPGAREAPDASEALDDTG
jgi:hypothetical protein